MGHNGVVCALAQSGPMIMTGSRDRLIKLYDMEAIQAPDSSPPQLNAAPSHVNSKLVCSRV